MVIPDHASSRERKIHSFLEKMNVHEVNPKTMLENKQKIKSTAVEQAFNEVKGRMPSTLDASELVPRVKANSVL